MSAATTSVWDWTPGQPACSLQPAGLIRLEGADALRVLHGQTSAAIEGARPGQWIPTCCISPTARLRALAEVLVTDGGATGRSCARFTRPVAVGNRRSGNISCGAIGLRTGPLRRSSRLAPRSATCLSTRRFQVSTSSANSWARPVR